LASVSSRGDSYDNVLAAAFNGLYEWGAHLHDEITDDTSYATPGSRLSTTVRPKPHKTVTQ
jgi:hypothetical protein